METLTFKISEPELAFECQICQNHQTVNSTFKTQLPFCNQCKEDLKQIILERRKNTGWS